MKKGFTLIELLAVILILGIIALIAIPTVNNIIKEARTGAFLTSSNNMMKQIEQDCQTSLLKGENPTLSYTFSNNESSSKIEIKGTLPNDGYILLNKECTITDYYLSDNNSTYSNAEDVREDYMLKAPVAAETSIFRTLYPSYYSSFVSVNFVKHLNIPENAIDIQDPSISQKGKIKSWLVPNGSNYDLYIGSEGTIYANYNSSSLFYNFTKNKKYDFSNFKTSFVSDFSFMFYANKSMIELDLSSFDTSNGKDMTRFVSNSFDLKRINVSSFNTKNVTTLYCLFCNCYSLESVDVSNFNTSNVVNMESIFNDCRSLKKIDVSNFDTSKVTNMNFLFGANDVPAEGVPVITMALTEIIGLDKFDTSNVTEMYMIFANSNLLTLLDLSTWNFDKVTNFSNMFSNTTGLINIKIKDANALNKISNYLPTKPVDNPGTITVIGDKTGINTTILESKHWNIN